FFGLFFSFSFPSFAFCLCCSFFFLVFSRPFVVSFHSLDFFSLSFLSFSLFFSLFFSLVFSCFFSRFFSFCFFLSFLLFFLCCALAFCVTKPTFARPCERSLLISFLFSLFSFFLFPL